MHRGVDSHVPEPMAFASRVGNCLQCLKLHAVGSSFMGVLGPGIGWVSKSVH